MELNVWTSTKIVGQPTFDNKRHQWTVRLSRDVGFDRVIHPRHIVFATGHYPLPYVPQFPGAELYKGDLIHTSQFTGPEKYSGKRVVIIGSCTSAHDIAAEFYDHKAKSVTMVQRSSTFVIRQPSIERHLFTPLYCEGGPSADDADLFACSIPFPVSILAHQEITRKVGEDDKELLENLASQGFKVDYGYEGAGIHAKFIAKGGGYYIDVGCSQLICDGKIKVKQGKQVQRIVEDGLILEDGTKLDADLIVLATGYLGMKEAARQIFGDEIGDRIPQVGGLNDEAEFAGLWQSNPCISLS
jgi:cation diffusion facilitator CzcD-associated flavoprotein CzcO